MLYVLRILLWILGILVRFLGKMDLLDLGKVMYCKSRLVGDSWKTDDLFVIEKRRITNLGYNLKQYLIVQWWEITSWEEMSTAQAPLLAKPKVLEIDFSPTTQVTGFL
jgi:hypothetical protein